MLKTNVCSVEGALQLSINMECKPRNEKVNSNHNHVDYSFSKEKIWEINKTNRVLKKKIDAITSKIKTLELPVIKPPGMSHRSVNQKKKAKEISKENQLLANRIKCVKSTIKK